MEKKKWKAGTGKLWNEPNSPYWQGTVEEFCKMYDYAADGL